MIKGKYNVAIVGATGLVGREIMRILAERKFPIESLRLLASSRSAGKKLFWNNQQLIVEELKSDSFKKIDFAFFSAGGLVSRKFAPLAVKEGACVIDNTSVFRMDPNVPLIVPEVNGALLSRNQKGIIANPNCSTIQMVIPLDALDKVAPIKRVVVSTYQSVSGAGLVAMNTLKAESEAVLANKEIEPSAFPHQIAFNPIPHIDVFLENGYTKEEQKMMQETDKILGKKVNVSATCVRLPVFVGHCESINVEFEKEISMQQLKEAIVKKEGLFLIDTPEKNEYPLAVDATGKDGVFVGRLRRDPSITNGINLWVVADNLRKGAALNAVQIAQRLL